MATYNGWTEIREYRIWQGEEVYASATVTKHINGWYQVDTDGYDYPYKTRSEPDAFVRASQRAEECAQEALRTCPCGLEAMECGEAYGLPHAVRIQVMACEENRELDFWER